MSSAPRDDVKSSSSLGERIMYLDDEDDVPQNPQHGPQPLWLNYLIYPAVEVALLVLFYRVDETFHQTRPPDVKNAFKNSAKKTPLYLLLVIYTIHLQGHISTSKRERTLPRFGWWRVTMKRIEKIQLSPPSTSSLGKEHSFCIV